MRTPLLVGLLLAIPLVGTSTVHAENASPQPALRAPSAAAPSGTTGERSDWFTLKASAHDWQRIGQGLLFRLAGDDLHASFGLVPKVEIVKVPSPNAFAVQPNRIVLSAGLCNTIEQPDELAFVIAHEVAHFKLGHHHESSDSLNSFMAAENARDQLEQELEADRFALELMKSAGLDSSAPAKLLRRLINMGAAQGVEMDEVYPTLSARLDHLQRISKQL